MKRKSLQLNSFVLMSLFLCMTLLVMSFGAYGLTAKADVSINAGISSDLTVQVAKHDGTVLNTNPQTVTLKYGTSEQAGYNRYTFNWSDVRNFNIKFDTSKLVNASSYNYKYTVTWTPALVQDGIANFVTDHSHTKVIFQEEITAQGAVTEETLKNQVKSEINFLIDNNAMEAGNKYTGLSVFGEDSEYAKRGGWGMYIFTFEDATSSVRQTAVFELLPTNVRTLATPAISFDVISSQAGVKDAYLFSVDQTYTFVDRSLIKWFVEGKGKDGRNYVLAPSDVLDPSVQNSIFDQDAYPRNGLTFKFDTALEGSWSVRCEVFDTDGSKVHVSQAVPISTVKGFSKMAIVWIVVGTAAAAALVVGVVIVISIKKEKVY